MFSAWDNRRMQEPVDAGVVDVRCTRWADYPRQIPWNGENYRAQELQEVKDAGG